ncbi:mycothiol synthase [Zhihengliuella alba]|uniref:Mycothiol acetyltransferase n=1 Tax=Zhihengliuella alba TaxID=547018 RepID=A0ABP7D4M6_9MICC
MSDADTTATTDWTIRTRTSAPTAEQLEAIEALAAGAAAADGNPPLSEQTLVELRTGSADLFVALAYLAESPAAGAPSPVSLDGADLVGVAVAVLPKPTADGPGVLELVVHPRFRCDGIGGALADVVAAQTDVQLLRAWSHGQHDGAARLAERHGFEPVRELWRMRLSGHTALDQPELPAGVRLRTFVPGHDDQKWLSANAEAFAHHPEQGGLTLTDLKARMAEDWFDPAGFFLAVDDEDNVLGYHWTKVHPAATDETGEHAAIGEVYVVGVLPGAQGGGLGRALTVAGVNYLLGRDVHGVMLYVDADNTAAVKLYERLGFTRWDVDVMFGPRA